MKIPYHQLVNHLKQTLAPIYVLSGDEVFLLQEAVNNMRAHAAKKEFTQHDFFQLEKGFDWKIFSSAANNATIFDEKIILELRCDSTALNDAGNKVLKEYAGHPNPDRILLITLPKLDAATQKKPWFTAIDKVGIIVQIWPLDAKQFNFWLQSKIQQMGLNVEREGLQLLAEYTGANLTTTNQELEKLSLIFGTQKVSAKQMLAAITDSAHFDVFDLTNALYLKTQEQTIRILENLKSVDAEPNIILWALTRELRLLINAKNALQEGQGIDQVLKKHKVHFSLAPTFKIILKNIDFDNLLDLLKKAGEIDLIAKGALSNNKIWHEVMRLVLQCQSLCFDAARP